MTHGDPELIALLIAELERHGAAIAAGRDDASGAARAVGALRGSAALAGERELASALTRVDRRLRSGDAGALADARELVRTASTRLAAGQSATVASWPEPPTDLEPCATEPDMRAPYLAELSDRISRIDDALGSSAPPIEAAEYIYRQVHTIKGAASALGDEPMSWFCHGLEELLRSGMRTGEEATATLHAVAKWRGVLGRLVNDPQGGLQLLRSITGAALAEGAPSLHDQAGRDTRAPGDGATYRVPAAAVDRLIDRIARLAAEGQRKRARAANDAQLAAELRELRRELTTALRLIGPPVPWGAPAAALARVRATEFALARIGASIESEALRSHAAEQQSGDTLLAANAELSTMRQTPIEPLLERLTRAVVAEARRSGREVAVVTSGGHLTIDRRVAEQLADPCLQLARNAVAHGIEPPAIRLAAGKPATGAIRIAATKTLARLQLIVEDDGAGVDVGEIRRRAVAAGTVTPAIAGAADDDTLLALLFFPGFSTHETSDWLAGRGLGLDIALAAVQRIAGTIRLSTRLGRGLTASVEVPVDTGVTRILWVHAGGQQ